MHRLDLGVLICNVEMFLIHTDKPLGPELTIFRASPTASGKLLARRRVDGQREEILRLHKVRDKATIDDEVDQTRAVDQDGQEEYHEEDILPWLITARGVILKTQGCSELLKLRVFR